MISRLRDQGVQVIQYNHPRAGVSGITSIGYFNNFGYDPDVDRSRGFVVTDSGVTVIAKTDGLEHFLAKKAS